MRESGYKKSALRQIEKIKALSEDMLEYQAIDVYKAWLNMEHRTKQKACMKMFRCFYPCRSYSCSTVAHIFAIILLFILYDR